MLYTLLSLFLYVYLVLTVNVENNAAYIFYIDNILMKNISKSFLHFAQPEALSRFLYKIVDLTKPHSNIRMKFQLTTSGIIFRIDEHHSVCII